MNYLFSNEIVFRGHPDKVCDQISAAIVQECIIQDPDTRAGIEVAGGKGKIFITGELTTKADIDICKTAALVLEYVGYKGEYEIIDNVGRQSADIALGVDKGGAGDQGVMFGYACRDTESYLPLAMVLLQRIAKEYDRICLMDDRFLPDGKAQITGEYDEKGHLIAIKKLVISYQNTEEDREGTDEIIREMIHSIVDPYCKVEELLINPTGRFRIGGFEGDAGLTGRKIVVDAYQGFAPVGGGCMNGKDPSKVDFSAAHKARNIAIRFLNTMPEVSWCEVQLSYAIGIAKPMSIRIRTDLGEFPVWVRLYDQCTPARMIEDLHLRDVDFVRLAAFGHFQED